MLTSAVGKHWCASPCLSVWGLFPGDSHHLAVSLTECQPSEVQMTLPVEGGGKQDLSVKATLCNSPICRSVVVLQVFQML